MNVTLRYQPASLVEYDEFCKRFCENCENDRTYRETGQHGCNILGNTFLYEVHDNKYPKEWTYKNLKPVCTAFRSVERPYRCDKTIDMFDNQRKKSQCVKK